jgi:serine protease AprX
VAHILKIYGDDANAVVQMPGSRVVARYPAFTVVEVADDAVRAASEGRLTEDITGQYSIQHDGLAIDTAMPRIDAAGVTVAHPAYEGAPSLPRGPHHYILQFIGPIKQSWLTQARKAGAEIVAPYGGFAVIARLAPDAVAAVSKLSSIRWLGHLPYSARLSRHIREQAGLPEATTPRTRYAPGVYTLQFFQAAQATAAKEQVARLGFEILEYLPDSEMLVVRSKSDKPEVVQRRLHALSRIHGVRQIAARPIPRTSNDRAAVIMGTAASLGAPPALGLSGDGEIIGVCDTGLDNGNPATIHPDFAGRIAAIKSYAISPSFSAYVLNPGHDDGPADLDSGHGTHTSGSVLGDGTAGANLPGLAGPIREGWPTARSWSSRR